MSLNIGVLVALAVLGLLIWFTPTIVNWWKGTGNPNALSLVNTLLSILQNVEALAMFSFAGRLVLSGICLFLAKVVECIADGDASGPKAKCRDAIKTLEETFNDPATPLITNVPPSQPTQPPQLK